MFCSRLEGDICAASLHGSQRRAVSSECCQILLERGSGRSEGLRVQIAGALRDREGGQVWSPTPVPAALVSGWHGLFHACVILRRLKIFRVPQCANAAARETAVPVRLPRYLPRRPFDA